MLHYSSRLPGARHPARLPPQTTLEETVLDLADVSPTAEDAVAWAIKACQRRLTTPDRITAALARRNRVRWRRDLTDAVAEVRTGVHSPLELRYLRDVERKHGLPRGDRQAVIIRSGTRQYADVRYTEYGVVVELDGVLAHPAEARKYDSRRDNANTLDGFQTLRYGWVPVAYHACAVAREVADLLQSPRLERKPAPLCKGLPGHNAEEFSRSYGGQISQRYQNHADNSKKLRAPRTRGRGLGQGVWCERGGPHEGPGG